MQENDLVFITIDGDDIGNKITQAFLENDEKKLNSLNIELNLILEFTIFFGQLEFTI